MDFVDRAPLSLDKDRVTCLLLINTYLMKKCFNMYTNIITNQQFMQQMSQEQRQGITYSYGNCIKRLQCNLATLNYIHEKYNSPNNQQQLQKQSFPVMLSAPQDMPELQHLYSKLQELYADAVQYLKHRIEEMRKQQMLNQNQQMMSQPQGPQQQQQNMTPQNMTPQQHQPNMGPPQSIPPQNIPPQNIPPQNIPPQQMPQMQQQPQSQQMDDMFMNDNYPQNDSMPSSTQDYQNYDNNMNNYNNQNNGINSMSTLSPQQILQQANESKSTPSMTHMDFGLF
ncbi:unnamed protein product [Candida verbasci]|uniref:Uncharacterized protein n=1 Tax=Candida verbasci TaxID=1227364 RepID=A0A9W4TUV0_9ASCO|nr:unnamed protein product [Candida verbasci]